MGRILAIETSCDETAAAVVVDGRHIVSNVVANQIELHRRFGGVYPEVASRQHVLAIQTVVAQALHEANITHMADCDAIAVTRGPGLAGSLLVGVNMAKGLAFASGAPLLGINHLEGHLYSNWLETAAGPGARDDFPMLHLIVSGGHTELILMEGHGVYRYLGGTLDDAAGEAFDKVARLLGLTYPGGPAIEQAALSGEQGRFRLPRPLLGAMDHHYNFSFSGLKTAVLNLTRRLEADGVDPRAPQTAADIALAFQDAVVEVLTTKTVDAAQEYGVRQVAICGGVSANSALRAAVRSQCAALAIPLHIPPLFLCTDNAAMIAAAAHYHCGPNGAAGVEGLALDVLANDPLVTQPLPGSTG